MNKIYNNKPYNIAKNGDLVGTAFKAETIRNILDNNTAYFEENNMIALYGNWGSGKTSVMKYIETKTTNYKTVFFEAWKYEHDTNLALSLFEQIVARIEEEKKVSDEIIENVKIAGKTVLNFGKNVLFNSEVSILGINLAVGQTAKDTLNEIEGIIKNKSFYSEVTEFDKQFKSLIEDYYRATSKKILIIVDDLDRCESDNILTLLSSIKHFFTDSDKVVYFCGIDKDAVSKAINIKYNNILKSEEYLEKIFDLTFNMPEVFSIDEFINDFFLKINVQNETIELSKELLKDFFHRINFTNPRKVKKVLNKYLYLNNLVESEADTTKYIPEEFSKHYPLQMVLVMFVIILYEFQRNIFESIYDFESKFAQIINIHNKANQIHTKQNQTELLSSFINNYRKRYSFMKVDRNLWHLMTNSERRNDILILIMILLPTDISDVNIPMLNTNSSDDLIANITNYILQFRTSEQKILYQFAIMFFETFTNINKSKYTINTSVEFYKLFQMANLYF